MDNINSGQKIIKNHFLDCPQQQEELLRSIYNNVQEAIFIVDLESDGTLRYVDMNPAGKRLTGINEIAGKTISELFSPSVATTIEAHYRECLRSQESIIYGSNRRMSIRQLRWRIAVGNRWLFFPLEKVAVKQLLMAIKEKEF